MKPFSEAAEYLKMSHSTLYKLTSSRKIVHYKPLGKLIYFDVSDLDEFLRKNRIETDEENSQEAKKNILTSVGRQLKRGRTSKRE